MKEAVLNPSDRAALQGLIPLAGALGAGTIFALFFGGRRRAGFAVFEVFVVIAVLTAVATTAYFCISLLHRNQPISDHELTQTATPLIVAVFFLGFVSVFARIPGSFERAAPIVGIALIGGGLAAWLASSAWTATPENASLVAVTILGVGVLFGLVAWAADWAMGRVHMRSERTWEQRQLKRLAKAGYAPAAGTFGLALPRAEDDAQPRVTYWTREGRTYLDFGAFRGLCREAEARWNACSTGDAHLPAASPVLLRVETDWWIPRVTAKPNVRLVTASPGVRSGCGNCGETPTGCSTWADSHVSTAPAV